MKRSFIRIAILVLLCLYTFVKVLQLLPHQPTTAGIISFSLFFLMIVGIRFSRRWNILALVTNILISVWSIFIMLSIPFDVCLVVYGIFSSLPILHLAKQIELFVLGLSLVLSLLGLIEALRGPIVKTVECKIPNLPEDLENFRIVQLSDLHIGPTIKRKYIEKVVRQTNALVPDAIVVTGDIADAKPHTITADIQPLSQLQAKYGTFYVTGNHEYYWGAQEWIAAVTSLGFIALINENKIIRVNQTSLMIAGITDSISGNFIHHHAPNIPQAVDSSIKTDLKILLSHRPSFYKEAEENGVTLQFSGHTHGGQYFPFNLMISFFHTYYAHLNRYKNLWLYVNTGTGYWGPINRLGVRAEITLCLLKRA